MADQRYWICDTNPDNVLPAISKVVGYPVVGITDEEAGGIIASAALEHANTIVEALNALADEKDDDEQRARDDDFRMREAIRNTIDLLRRWQVSRPDEGYSDDLLERAFIHLREARRRKDDPRYVELTNELKSLLVNDEGGTPDGDRNA